ncbi:MAG: ABC transporter permease [Chloroflexi bacterium]|nr:MAG: ABC transporter permease [Chloroflexota bacterium]
MSLRAWLWNPIVAKEYRSRMRTMRSPVALTAYILAIGGLGWAVFSTMAADASLGGGAGNYGRNLFVVLILFQMILLTFITPALTSTAISGERERQTIDLLFCTRVPPFAIMWGKLLASMSFVILLLVVSIPIFSLVFLFGGIEADQLATAFLVTAVSALALGSVGICCSTLVRRTTMATMTAYGASFLLVFATLAWGLIFPTRVDPATLSQTPAPPAIVYAGPLLGLSWIAGQGAPVSWLDAVSGGQFGVRYGGGSDQPIPMAKAALAAPRGLPAPAISTLFARSGIAQPAGPKIPSGAFAGWQYWQATVALEAALALLALALSAAVLPPVRRYPWRRRGAPAGVAVDDAHA